MFAVRKLRIQNWTTILLRRGNVNLQGSLDSTSPAPLPPAILSPEQPIPSTPAKNTRAKTSTTQCHRRRRREPILLQRPSISRINPRKWNRPLAEGVLPAYDRALKVIRTDSIQLLNEARELEALVVKQERIVQRPGDEPEVEEALEKMREKLYILQVQSEINLPEVRWRVANAMVDMRKPIHRHLIEQRWRKEGRLDLLMERIHQMKVIPDVLPDLHPSIDLNVTVRTYVDKFRKTKPIHDVAIEPGTFLSPEQTLMPPRLYANVFHTDTRLYTMLLVDPDVPNEEEATFSTFLHWLKPNVPLSALHQTRIPDLNSHTPYIPPHPQRGTPYHRYVLLLLPQPPASGSSYTRNAEARAQSGITTSAYLNIPPVTDAQRRQFDVRAFVRQWGLDDTKGGGAHMWREIWDETVSKIYSDLLKEEEPSYGKPLKTHPYAELRRTKRYV